MTDEVLQGTARDCNSRKTGNGTNGQSVARNSNVCNGVKFLYVYNNRDHGIKVSLMSAKQFDVFNFEYKIHQSLLSFICSSSFLLSDALEDRCALCSLSNRTDIHIQDTNIVVQFRSIGRLTTIDMNSPLLSKYWCFVKILQGLQAPMRSPQSCFKTHSHYL